jgi:hypothetical protein
MAKRPPKNRFGQDCLPRPNAMRDTPTDPELNRLLKEGAKRPMTPCEVWDQRVSFVWGQMMDCAPEITRAEIEQQVARFYGPRPSQ